MIRKSLAREDKQTGEHFRLSEFRCEGPECAGKLPSYISPKLVEILEQIRDRCGGRPIHILSGFRCPTHNAAVGGASESRHMHGDAADIRIEGMATKTLHAEVDLVVADRGGVGYYPRRGGRAGFVHVDARGQRARWTG